MGHTLMDSSLRLSALIVWIGVTMFCASTNIVAQDQGTERHTEPSLDIGGVLRYNFNYSSWKPNQIRRGGDFGFEVFRINVDAVRDRWEIHLDQRVYAEASGGLFLKYGWFQFNIKPDVHIKVGLIPAYFGVQQFNSHSWFFQLPFYLGFEDDHDMGVSLDVENESITLDVGFYKGAERLSFADNSPISDSRYNYDFSGRNQEINQLNIRFNYKYGSRAKHQIGTSFQYGGIWNIDTQEIGSQLGIGLQYELNLGALNLKAQYLNYNNRPRNAPGESVDIIEMTAYGAPYNTASKASIYSVGVGLTLPVEFGPVRSAQIYNDYSFMDKAVSGWEDTQMNVLGVLFDAAPVYLYVDYGMGKHHPWLGPQWTDALTTGDPDQGWETRFNINIGYYF